ncbi:MAG: hypothetical protein M3094_05320 [Actinomycetia bacterium]|nr:hypothetical protein [Actinomycetes bacterium]
MSDIPDSHIPEDPGHAGEERRLECEACGREDDESNGEWILVDTTRVDGMVVFEDHDWICQTCIDDATDAQTERKLDAAEWAGHDAWEEKATMGVER